MILNSLPLKKTCLCKSLFVLVLCAACSRPSWHETDKVDAHPLLEEAFQSSTNRWNTVYEEEKRIVEALNTLQETLEQEEKELKQRQEYLETLRIEYHEVALELIQDRVERFQKELIELKAHNQGAYDALVDKVLPNLFEQEREALTVMIENSGKPLLNRAQNVLDMILHLITQLNDEQER